MIHKGGKRKLHTRKPICLCGELAELNCVSCSCYVCSYCKRNHSAHSTAPVSVTTRTAVFWDIDTCPPLLSSDLSEVIGGIRASVAGVYSIQVYGKQADQ